MKIDVYRFAEEAWNAHPYLIFGCINRGIIQVTDEEMAQYNTLRKAWWDSHNNEVSSRADAALILQVWGNPIARLVS